ncbi:YceI family protein [Caulobacter sp. KR2-114]|uniref:YceI family protein n=1 Tax=Caulobacter sp. KR2-114 TaxID=3400912 RepID=UPI003C045FE4
MIRLPARLAALAAVVLVPAAAVAAPAPAWTVDKAASHVTFASSFSGTGFTGGFRRWDAAIRFDPKNLAGSSVTATIDTGSAATGSPDRDQALPTDTFFAAGRFPKASFVATSFKDLGGGRYQAIGTLTIRGVAKPLTLPFTLAITGAQAHMTAAVAVNRLAYGVGQGEWQATEAIPAAVTVSLDLTARRAR